MRKARLPEMGSGEIVSRNLEMGSGVKGACVPEIGSGEKESRILRTGIRCVNILEETFKISSTQVILEFLCVGSHNYYSDVLYVFKCTYNGSIN